MIRHGLGSALALAALVAALLPPASAHAAVQGTGTTAAMAAVTAQHRPAAVRLAGFRSKAATRLQRQSRPQRFQFNPQTITRTRSLRSTGPARNPGAAKHQKRKPPPHPDFMWLPTN